MSDLVTRAQLEMLARTLHVPVDRIQHLDRLGAENVQSLREALANVLFDEHAETFSRVSALVPIAPLKIFLPIVQKKVPAMMAGRAAGAVGLAHPNKAAPALALLSTEYAADAAPYMDPRAVEKLVHIAPPGPVVEIANEILRRGDYATAGLFVDFATPELIRIVEQGVQDDEGLLRAGSYVRSGKTLSNVMRVIIEASPHRISRMITTAVNGPTDLRLATLSVLSRIDDDLIAVIGDVLFDGIDREVVTDLLSTYIREGAAAELLTFASHLSPSGLDMLAANPVLADQELVSDVVRAVAAENRPAVWRGLLDVAERADEHTQRRLARLIAELGDSPLADLGSMASAQHLWPVLLRVLANQDADIQTRIGSVWQQTLCADDQTSLEQHMRDLHLGEELRPVTAALTIAG